jgi:Fe-S cluster assembly protein SufD
VTITDAATNVANAVEAETVLASHLHPAGSFDLADHPVPQGREEVWRFTPLKRLRGLHNSEIERQGSVKLSLQAPDVVSLTDVGRDDVRLGSIHVPNDRVSAFAWQQFSSAQVLSIPAGAELDRPVILDIDGNGATAFTHLFIEVGAHSMATVVLRNTGTVVLAGNIEVSVGDGATINLISIQDWADDAVHLAHVHARVGRDATYKQGVVSFGGDLVRINSEVDYAGPGGSVDMLGLYFVDAGQHIEHRLFVDHNAPHTRSNVDYRGALQGQGAHSVWIGDVLIRKAAEGIETYEQNRNLVLTDGCQADSVPNLEIQTGEIEGAGHASTTGRFDDEQLFYLQSRGVPGDEARRLVVHGFFNDIVRKLSVPEIEEDLLATVEAELSKNVGPAS